MGLLRLTPWRRGPGLLLRRPGVALALLAAALVAALPAAAAPLFLSSAQHATLHRQIDENCPYLVGGQFIGEVSPPVPYTFEAVLDDDSVVGAERYQRREAAVAANPVDGLTSPISTGYGEINAELVDRPMPNPDLRGLMLLAREGSQDQVEVLEGPAGEGLWLPHEHAQAQGIEVGDELVLSPRPGEPGAWEVRQWDDEPPEPTPVTLPVAAIYRDLRTVPVTSYWCGVEHVYAGTPSEQADPDAIILPTALVDIDTLLAAGEATGMVAGQVVELAVEDLDLPAPEAARLAEDLDALKTSLYEEHPELFPVGRSDDTSFESRLGRFGQRAELVRTGLLPPVLPITAAGTLVGLAVAAAAAIFWVQRRRQELTVLAAHGLGTGALGTKAILEALPAVLTGTVGGWAAAWALVTAVGPSPVLAPGTLPLAAAAAAITGLAALGLIGGLAAVATRTLTDTRPVTHRPHWWRRLPWELTLLAAAPVAWLLLASDQTVDATAGGVGSVAHVPARLLVAPILVIAGLAGFAARTVAWSLRRRGLTRTPGSPARLLAWRRSVRTAATTAILAAATAVPVAIATYGATATDSIRTTADAKLRFGLGSDTVITYQADFDQGFQDPPPVPEPMTGHATQVLRFNQQRLDGLIVEVLAVDPDTFTDGAFWDSRISGPSLTDAVNQLTAEDTPVVIANRRIAPGPATLTVRDHDIPVEVGATRPLPGSQPSYPMVLVHRDLLERTLSDEDLVAAWQQLWVAGDPDRTLAGIADAELPASRASTVDDQRVGAVYEPVTYTFQYLIALSIFTGLIGAVGLLLHLESRTTAHRRAYVMLRRLGLRAGAHRRAILLEVGAPVLAGLLAGIGGAVAIAYTVRSGLDVNPDRFPHTLVALPTTMTAIVCVAAAVIAAGASLLTHARITRANPAEVLRDTT